MKGTFLSDKSVKICIAKLSDVIFYANFARGYRIT